MDSLLVGFVLDDDRVHSPNEKFDLKSENCVFVARSAATIALGKRTFYRQIDAAGAAELGLPLRPTELLIFGSAKAGTPLMQANQAIGIDLPLKALFSRMRRARYGCPIMIRAGLHSGTGSARPTSGKLRIDGRVLRDMYLYQIKTPAESKYPWDYLKLLQTIPADEAFRPLDEGGCPLVPKR